MGWVHRGSPPGRVGVMSITRAERRLRAVREGGGARLSPTRGSTVKCLVHHLAVLCRDGISPVRAPRSQHRQNVCPRYVLDVSELGRGSGQVIPSGPSKEFPEPQPRIVRGHSPLPGTGISPSSGAREPWEHLCPHGGSLEIRGLGRSSRSAPGRFRSSITARPAPPHSGSSRTRTDGALRSTSCLRRCRA